MPIALCNLRKTHPSPRLSETEAGAPTKKTLTVSRVSVVKVNERSAILPDNTRQWARQTEESFHKSSIPYSVSERLREVM